MPKRFDFGDTLFSGYLHRSRELLELFLGTACPFHIGKTRMYLQVERFEKLDLRMPGGQATLSGTAILKRPIKGRASNFTFRLIPTTREFDFHFDADFTLAELMQQHAMPLMNAEDRECCERLLVPILDACTKPEITIANYSGRYARRNFHSGITFRASLATAGVRALSSLDQAFTLNLPQSLEIQIYFPLSERDKDLTFYATANKTYFMPMGHECIQLRNISLNLNRDCQTIAQGVILDFGLDVPDKMLTFSGPIDTSNGLRITGRLQEKRKTWAHPLGFRELRIQRMLAVMTAINKPPYLTFEAEGRFQYRSLVFEGKAELFFYPDSARYHGLTITMPHKYKLDVLIRGLTRHKVIPSPLGNMTFSDMSLTFSNRTFTAFGHSFRKGIAFKTDINLHQLEGSLSGIIDLPNLSSLNGSLKPIIMKKRNKTLFSFTGVKPGTDPGVAICMEPDQPRIVTVMGKICLANVVSEELEINGTSRGMTAVLENEKFGVFHQKEMTIRQGIFTVKSRYLFNTECSLFGATLPFNLSTSIVLEINKSGMIQTITGQTRLFNRTFACSQTTLLLPCLEADNIFGHLSKARNEIKGLIKAVLGDPDECIVRQVSRKCKLTKKKTGRLFRAAGADRKLLCRLFRKVFDCSPEQAAGYAAGNRRDRNILLAQFPD